jgi:Outer membrane protein beta-barrel domain
LPYLNLKMKKLILVFCVISCTVISFAQAKKDWKKIDLSSRPGDHFMLQLSSDHWTGVPDSIKNHQKGISRGGNIYVMMDKPFKTNPRFSIGLGIGVGTSSMYFEKLSIGVQSGGSILPFKNLDTLDHFKKYKLVSSFLEIPVELRFSSDPLNDKKSIKGALGIKVGTLLNVHTKGKNLQNKAGNTINSYTEKENRKNFFNTTRLCLTARAGVGHFSLFGSYSLNNIFKDGAAAAIKPFQVGICLSGL